MASSPFEKNEKVQQIEYVAGRVDVESLPTELTIVVSDRCNLNCMMCGIGVTPEKYRFTIYEDAIEKCRVLYPYLRKLELDGSEIFAEPWGKGSLTDRIIAEALPHEKMKLCGFTNATLINEVRAELIVEKFWVLSISLDSPQRQVYNSIRIGAEFNQVIQNIERINTEKIKRGLRPQDPPLLQFAAIVMDKTFRDLPELVKLVGKIGGVFISFNPLKKDVPDEYWEKIKSEDIFSDHQKVLLLQEKMQQVKEIAKKLNIKITDNTQNKLRKHFPELIAPKKEAVDKQQPVPVCRYAWKSLFVHPPGFATFARCSRAILGNLREESLETVWKGRAAQEERKNFLIRDYHNCTSWCVQGYPTRGKRKKWWQRWPGSK